MTESHTLKALAVVFFSYGIIVGFFVSEMRQAIVQHHLTYGPGFSKDQLRNPAVNNPADTTSNISDVRVHHLASDSANELKVEIFHAYHIAAVANISAAMAIAFFLIAWAIRSIIRTFRDS